ncbi:unnamed protein product [Effrenium voratum]|nr:unnamed protein product [Effrenium voratum]
MLHLSTRDLDNDDLAKLQPSPAKKPFWQPQSVALPGMPEDSSCSHCGASVLNDVHFCRKCGHARSGQAALVSVPRRSEGVRRMAPFSQHTGQAPSLNAPPRLIARLQELELDSLLALCERLEGRLVRRADEELDALCESLTGEAKGAKALPQHQQQPRARPRALGFWARLLGVVEQALHVAQTSIRCQGQAIGWGTFGRTAPMLLRMQWLLGKAQELKEAHGLALGPVCLGPDASIVIVMMVQQRKLLADGGFAYVFAGLDADTGERLAIRRVLLQDKEALAKAKVEIELLSGLCDHPHVVRFQGAEIFQRGAGAEAVYIFELCPNGTLLAHIEAHKDQAKAQGRELLPYCCPCLEEKDILDVLGATAQALAYLTRLGMIHYDVKSENLLLGNDGLWKLGDFGSASEHSFDLEKAEKKALLEAQEFIHGRCTPMYRAPELADVYLRWKIGPKVDIFALGCIIFATMTGQHPFPMESTCGNITASYRLPPEATECYSSVLLGWLRGLLARLPAERPSAVRLAAEVERFKLGEPPAAPAPATSSARPTKAAPQTMAAPDASPWQADFATFSPVQDSVNGAGLKQVDFELPPPPTATKALVSAGPTETPSGASQPLQAQVPTQQVLDALLIELNELLEKAPEQTPAVPNLAQPQLQAAPALNAPVNSAGPLPAEAVKEKPLSPEPLSAAPLSAAPLSAAPEVEASPGNILEAVRSLQDGLHNLQGLFAGEVAKVTSELRSENSGLVQELDRLRALIKEPPKSPVSVECQTTAEALAPLDDLEAESELVAQALCDHSMQERSSERGSESQRPSTWTARPRPAAAVPAAAVPAVVVPAATVPAAALPAAASLAGALLCAPCGRSCPPSRQTGARMLRSLPRSPGNAAGRCTSSLEAA